MVPPCSDWISRVLPYSRIQWSLPIRGYHPLWPAFPCRSCYPHCTTGLVRVRSPLLAESRLMSFPPGNEMFQFPGFASYPYVFRIRSPLLAGLPHSEIHGSKGARPSPWLIAACYVLHRLSVPRHPPDALISFDLNPCCLPLTSRKDLARRGKLLTRPYPDLGYTVFASLCFIIKLNSHLKTFAPPYPRDSV